MVCSDVIINPYNFYLHIPADFFLRPFVLLPDYIDI